MKKPKPKVQKPKQVLQPVKKDLPTEPFSWDDFLTVISESEHICEKVRKDIHRAVAKGRGLRDPLEFSNGQIYSTPQGNTYMIVLVKDNDFGDKFKIVDIVDGSFFGDNEGSNALRIREILNDIEATFAADTLGEYLRGGGQLRYSK